MLAVAILLFSLGAFFGGWMVVALLREQRPPREVVHTHGALVASALAIVLYHVFTTDGSRPIASVVFFLLAVVGGIAMFVMESTGMRPSKAAISVSRFLS